MTSSSDRFSDRLVAAEQVDMKRKERYTMQVQTILHQTLTPAKRVAFSLGAVLGLFLAVLWGVMAATAHITGAYAAWGRAIFGIFTAFWLVGAAIAGRIAVRGTLNRQTDTRNIARFVWGLSLLIFIVLAFAGWLNLKYGSGSWAVFITAIGLAFLVTGTLTVIKNLVQQSELRVREKLLELELRLIEMSEKLGNPGTDSTPFAQG